MQPQKVDYVMQQQQWKSRAESRRKKKSSRAENRRSKKSRERERKQGEEQGTERGSISNDN